MTATTSRTAPDARTRPALLRGLQVVAALAVLVVLFQGVTAGQLFPGGKPATLHEAGAIVLHVVSGLAALAAVALWRQGRLGVGTTALAGAVFAFGFIQAAIGGYQTLYVHVPGALLLTVGTAALFVLVLRPRTVPRH